MNQAVTTNRHHHAQQFVLFLNHDKLLWGAIKNKKLLENGIPPNVGKIAFYSRKLYYDEVWSIDANGMNNYNPSLSVRVDMYRLECGDHFETRKLTLMK